MALDYIRSKVLSNDTTASSKMNTEPIIVRLNGLAQTNDMLAIREMGRQIAEQEISGSSHQDLIFGPDDDEDLIVDASAPTTLPSHLLTFLTAPSPRAIIVVIDGFDLFTEHARQALLYCLRAFADPYEHDKGLANPISIVFPHS